MYLCETLAVDISAVFDPLGMGKGWDSAKRIETVLNNEATQLDKLCEAL